VEPEAIAAATGGLAYPHTSHCLADGTVMVSLLGAKDGGDARGNYVLLDAEGTGKVVGRWAEEDTPFGYDFWVNMRRRQALLACVLCV
jgi:selenium-binding protein 1